MFRATFVRSAALALILYGLLGLFIGLAMAVVGYTAVSEFERLRGTLDQERDSLVRSLRVVSTTVGDAASATDGFEQSLTVARDSATTAALVAEDTARSFRGLAVGVQLQVFGIQPLGGLAPGFEHNARQMDALSESLSEASAALAQNVTEVRRVGGDLARIREQVDELATTLELAEVVVPQRQILPFQVAYFGMAALFALQSLFSMVAGVALYREQAMLSRLADMIELHHHRSSSH